MSRPIIFVLVQKNKTTTALMWRQNYEMKRLTNIITKYGDFQQKKSRFKNLSDSTILCADLALRRGGKILHRTAIRLNARHCRRRSREIRLRRWVSGGGRRPVMTTMMMRMLLRLERRRLVLVGSSSLAVVALKVSRRGVRRIVTLALLTTTLVARLHEQHFSTLWPLKAYISQLGFDYDTTTTKNWHVQLNDVNTISGNTPAYLNLQRSYAQNLGLRPQAPQATSKRCLNGYLCCK